MRVAQAAAMRALVQPVVSGRSEKPNPGSEGTTTWKASCGLPPCAVGSVRGPIAFTNSTKEPGQPWVRMSGVAFVCRERTCRKWMPRPSICVRYWPRALICRSKRRQSY